MEEYSLNQTLDNLKGPTLEQIVFHNQWAAVAFDRFHLNSQSSIKFILDGVEKLVNLKWDSKFSKSAMKEDVDMANHGGVAMAWFVMSVILDYSYVEQTEIGDGVDYRFRKTEPSDDELNFLDDYHYVEISGVLQEKSTNTLERRVKDKHRQIKRGAKRDLSSSVIVTLFEEPKTIKEIHN